MTLPPIRRPYGRGNYGFHRRKHDRTSTNPVRTTAAGARRVTMTGDIRVTGLFARVVDETIGPTSAAAQ